jgi:uncharacterized protein (DUF1697 family)
MAALKELVEKLGCRNVRTLLNSGNVVFSAAKAEPNALAAKIQEALEATLGVSARVIVLGAAELDAVMKANPLVRIADDHSRLMVSILGDKADRVKLDGICAQKWEGDRIALGAGPAARAFYMWLPTGLIESTLNAAVSKALKDGVTARNWATMVKLKEMVDGDE